MEMISKIYLSKAFLKRLLQHGLWQNEGMNQERRHGKRKQHFQPWRAVPGQDDNSAGSLKSSQRRQHSKMREAEHKAQGELMEEMEWVV